MVHATRDKGDHGAMSAALLGHKKLAKAFKIWDFAMNPCNPCIWNKVDLSKYIAIMFRMDNLMKLHGSSTMVIKKIKLLDEACGAKDPLTVTRDKNHEHLGMRIVFSLKRGVTATQCDCMKKKWMTLPPETKGNYRITPAPDLLLKVDVDAPLLNHARKNLHRANAAKTLWTSQ